MNIAIKRFFVILSALVFGFMYGNIICILELIQNEYFIFADAVLTAVVIYIIAALLFLRTHHGFCLFFIAPATWFGTAATGDFWLGVFKKSIESQGMGIVFLLCSILYADIFCTVVLLFIRRIRRKCMEHDAMMEEMEMAEQEEQ